MYLKSIKVGNLQLPLNLVLAPMSGITNSCFRRLIRLCNPDSVGLVVSEFISVEALTRNSERSLAMMRFREQERPVSVQVFGHDVRRMVDAVRMVEDSGADIVDINCGCPVPKVVKKGGGCELMRQPEHLARMLCEVRKVVSIPLTLKIRSGWDEQNVNALAIARIAVDSGVDMLAIHGRTRKCLYRGVANWDIVSEVARAVEIPVIGSGDIVDGASAVKHIKKDVSGLMIGRATLSNPWIFSEIEAVMKNREFIQPSERAVFRLLEDYMNMLVEEFADRIVLGSLKQLSSKLTRRVKHSRDLRKALITSKTLDEFRAILSGCLKC